MHRRHSPRLLKVENLERRELLAVLLDGDVLRITGTDNADTATIDPYTQTQEQWVTATLNGQSSQYAASSIRKIVFRGHRGDDFFVNNSNLRSHVWGNAGADTLIGGGGADRLYGGSWNDSLVGGAGNDRLFGGGANDTIHGGAGNDYIFGHNGADELHGEGGNDSIKGSSGNDLILGGGGNDYLHGHIGLDEIHGGNGNDTIIGHAGDDMICAGAGDDRVYGGSQNDTIFGEGGNDYLYGATGADNLYGGSGSDQLFGGDGNDGLFGGGSEADYLTGGAGSDRFLTQTGDSVQDEDASDAQLMFVDGTSRYTDIPRNWTDADVVKTDKALIKLHQEAGSALIFKDTRSDSPVKMYIADAFNLGSNVAGFNWFNGIERQIHVRGNLSNESFGATIVHEFGHNWDSSAEGNQAWYAFESAHGQSSTNSDYTRSYGQTNAKEDWATNWELFFGYYEWAAPSNPSLLLQQKQAAVRDFFADFAGNAS